MKKYGVLIVDDSAFMRKTIGLIIEASPQLYVAGKARNGIDAIEKILRLKPDLVTLDIEMPEQDGLETLKQIMSKSPLPVVMLSNGTAATLECFELGAVDFVIKSDLLQQNDQRQLDDFHKRLIIAANAKLPIAVATAYNVEEQMEEKPEQPAPVLQKSNKQLIIIGSSTGGPAALQTIITQFETNFNVPILIVQHMPPGFTKHLAERFNGLCNVRVKEAEHNEILEAGTIYIAPSGLQTTLKINEFNQLVVRLKISSYIETLYKPSIDVTLLSIAAELKNRLMAVILTGMGDDGLRGCTAVKQYGGYVIAESEETCVVYGMPKVVFEAGLVDKQKPLQQIYATIMDEV